MRWGLEAPVAIGRLRTGLHRVANPVSGRLRPRLALVDEALGMTSGVLHVSSSTEEGWAHVCRGCWGWRALWTGGLAQGLGISALGRGVWHKASVLALWKGGLAQGLSIRLFAFGGAYWPLATAHSDPLWVRTCFGCVNGAPG